ncbi:MAG: hypothetical protein R3D55_04905 [Chloroflexota bacterium]
MIKPEPATEPVAKPTAKPAKEPAKRNWLPIALGGFALLALIAAAIFLLPNLLAPDLPPRPEWYKFPAAPTPSGRISAAASTAIHSQLS